MRDFFVPSIGFPYWQEGLLNAGYFYPFNMFPYWQEGLLNVGYFLIRSIGLPYMQEGLLNAGYRDTCFRSRGGRVALSRGRLIRLASSASRQAGHRLASPADLSA